jgi:hypothetical protein
VAKLLEEVILFIRKYQKSFVNFISVILLPVLYHQIQA